MQLGENSGGKRHCCLGDVLNHTFGVLVEHGVVLDDDQRVAGLFKNGHELKDCEGSADLQILESAVQPAEGTRNKESAYLHRRTETGKEAQERSGLDASKDLETQCQEGRRREA